MEVLNKIYVANVAFHNVTMEEAVARIIQMAQKTGKPRYVCTGNLDHLVTLEGDAEFRAIYQESDLTPGGRQACGSAVPNWPLSPPI